ncbi:MAG: response regulator transcription factor [Defluviitaleaceae bacterium]|nr:response regulator transcription factor [Defluviitaleaceae bacterium]
MKRLIYAVEDDAALRELYSYTFENGFSCECFCDGKSFFEALDEKKPDIILLDVMLPGEDGFEILSRLKSDKKISKIPVIMISAKSEEIHKVKGLNQGADDYIAKPFGIMELVARVNANLRKNTIDTDIFTFKDLEINPQKHRIMANGKKLNTTLKEYNLLLLLCKNAENIQEREVIFSKIWGESFMGETRTLDIHIKELRKKLSEAQSEAEIKTIRGVGYILV